MNLFFFDHIIQLDSLAPLIDLIAKEKKWVLIINTNPTSLYKKNKLLKFFKDQNIQILNNPPLNIKNNMKLFLIKIITLLPKIFVQRLQGFWWKISIGIFLALAASRFIPHPPNFTSLLALSFYLPVLFGIKFLPVLLISFILTDFIIGFHNVVFFT